MKTRAFVSVLVGLLGFVWMGAANAVPSFAKKYEKTCSSCHTAWPQLNKAGRMFKEAGYKFIGGADKDQTIGDIKWDKIPPITAILVSRPYDKKSGSDAKLRAIHEIELVVAGRYTGNISGFFELEMEDETTEDVIVDGSTGVPTGSEIVGFNWVKMPHAAATYHVSKAVNVQAAYAPLHWADPYDTYAGNRTLTKAGLASGEKLGSSRQMVSIYGRPMNNLFYNIGIAGAVGDAEGVNPSTSLVRVAYDVTNNIMVGGLAVSGGGQSDTGLDVQADFADMRVSGSYLTGSGTNTMSLQAMYVAKDSNKKPTWVPLVRVDQDTAGVNATTVNLGYYFTSNAKGFLEYYTKGASNRVILQFVTAF